MDSLRHLPRNLFSLRGIIRNANIQVTTLIHIHALERKHLRCGQDNACFERIRQSRNRVFELALAALGQGIGKRLQIAAAKQRREAMDVVCVPVRPSAPLRVSALAPPFESAHLTLVVEMGLGLEDELQASAIGGVGAHDECVLEIEPGVGAFG